jgi:murein L,D-transpeptidase YafK
MSNFPRNDNSIRPEMRTNHIRLLSLIQALFILLPVLLFSATDGPGPGSLPVYLLKMGDMGDRYAILVDKKTQTLSLYQASSDEPRLVKEYRCTTGKNNGSKIKEGDKRTPNGVYFFKSRLEDDQLPEKYGKRAFPMDYPNDYDRLDDKSGSGIWLHAVDVDSRVQQSYDTEGCVVVTNKDIQDLTGYIALRETPIIIDDSIYTAPPGKIREEREQISAFIEKWRFAWQNKKLDAYIDCYDERFEGKQGMGRKQWRQYKATLNKTYKNITVKLADLKIYQYHSYVVVSFIQDYRSSGFQAKGRKLLYLVRSGQGYTIFSERM